MQDGLNPDQIKAMMTTDGPILILAGAGSGKTRVLTHKVSYLLREKNISADEILMVTFTNKAAAAMKDRIKNLLSDNGKFVDLPFSGTFHSLCAKILRRHGSHIGISPDFLIYDANDQKDAMKEVLTKLNISQKQYSPNSLLHAISEAKNELIDPISYGQYARGTFQEVVALTYRHYQSLLHKNQALDFDDLLMSTVDLFQKQPQVLEKYSRRFRYVLVDEYQDTNHAQYTLTKLLSSHWGNICVVGDASQSIYSWRGANFRNILNFKTDFPNVTIFHLEQNYRSTQIILDAASTMIAHNTTHPVLKLWTQNPNGEQIYVHETQNEQFEALTILSEIAKKGLKLSEAAILYRTNAQSRAIEEVFLHEGVPYVLVGGVRFYERKEVKDVLSYLRLVINPLDSVSLTRIEKVGKKRAAEFLNWQKKLTRNKSTLEYLDELLLITKYLSLYDEHLEEDRARLENIKELRSVASQFPSLTMFLENVALVESETFDDKKSFSETNKERITLMTMHAAKGLEFPAVFMVGMEEGLFPHSRSLFNREELEEERRLCYVGITRAQRHLYFLHARQRLFFGSRNYNVLSRFVGEIPSELLAFKQSVEI